ncbi:MAG: zf-HC2 domain-containing protein [Lachnospiraceae bacterium]|nr:zf-HC2 domain-containing protein [Lachnospiraceae bacterium]
MICKEWQRMIPGFLDDTLENQEMEGFIQHVQTCEDCYEELEIMFMLSIGLQELKEERNISYNFSQLLENKILEEEIRFERIRQIRSFNRLVIIILHILVGLGIAFQIIKWI